MTQIGSVHWSVAGSPTPDTANRISPEVAKKVHLGTDLRGYSRTIKGEIHGPGFGRATRESLCLSRRIDDLRRTGAL